MKSGEQVLYKNWQPGAALPHKIPTSGWGSFPLKSPSKVSQKLNKNNVLNLKVNSVTLLSLKIFVPARAFTLSSLKA